MLSEGDAAIQLPDAVLSSLPFPIGRREGFHRYLGLVALFVAGATIYFGRIAPQLGLMFLGVGAMSFCATCYTKAGYLPTGNSGWLIRTTSSTFRLELHERTLNGLDRGIQRYDYDIQFELSLVESTSGSTELALTWDEGRAKAVLLETESYDDDDYLGTDNRDAVNEATIITRKAAHLLAKILGTRLKTM